MVKSIYLDLATPAGNTPVLVAIQKLATSLAQVLSGYRLMWMLVMFDLPVMTKHERKAANDFRLNLLDMGFLRSQLSVYMRFCTSHTQVQTYCQRVEQALPLGGQVNILQMTDQQYERIISFQGRKAMPAKKTPDQFDLF